MSIAIAGATEVPLEVRAILRAKSAEEEYRETEELARELFPEMLALHVYLQEDPDEEGVNRVILRVILPESGSNRPLKEYLTPFFTKLHERLPSMTWPACGLSIDFARDDP